MQHLDTVIAAIDFMEQNLMAQRLDLETVAEAVHYSKFHLHRLFIETVGLSVHDYALRRRMTEAAKLLVFSDRPILHIAMQAGYDSQQAFGGAFKALYKMTPGAFRQKEAFYPLQLPFSLDGARGALPAATAADDLIIRAATYADIPGWMELVHLAVDGLPRLDDAEHIRAVRSRIEQGGALLMTKGGILIGAMMLTAGTGSIDFMAVHPLCRRQGVTRMLLDAALAIFEGQSVRQVSMTTFRNGDRADTGHRDALKALGFAEAELLEEFGYPTQRMVLNGEDGNA